MGESRFREMEESYFIEKSQHSELIVSTGGGIILSQKNRDILKKAVNVFYLKADPTFLITRLNKRFKRLFSSNNIIDVSVDLGLILFDVLSSPILIVMRVARYFFNKFVKDHVKRALKWIINKIL